MLKKIALATVITLAAAFGPTSLASAAAQKPTVKIHATPDAPQGICLRGMQC